MGGYDKLTVWCGIRSQRKSLIKLSTGKRGGGDINGSMVKRWFNGIRKREITKKYLELCELVFKEVRANKGYYWQALEFLHNVYEDKEYGWWKWW